METVQPCVKSILHGPKVIRSYINELVISTSELEARGSLVYSLALLRCNEQEALVPVEMFSQGFITRCFGSVSGQEARSVYGPSAICTRYLQDARRHVPPVADYEFSCFSQLINQLGRRMHTVMMTSLQTHMHSRRSRGIRTSLVAVCPNLTKSVYSFVTRHVLWRLSGAPDPPCTPTAPA